MAPTEIVSIPNDDRNLDAFTPEQGQSATNLPLIAVVVAGAPPPPAALPAPFSRLEAAQARRARRTARAHSQRRAAVRHAGALVERAAASAVGYALALCVLIALRCDSFTHLVGRAARGAFRATRRAGRAAAHLTALGLGQTLAAAVAGGARVRQHAASLRRSYASTRHLESEGSLVAVALAVVVICYGGLVTISWRHPAPTASTFAVAAAHAAGVDTTNAGATQAIVAVAPMPPDRAVEVPRHVRAMNASTLNTIWSRTDTRSLQGAFAGLRRETLAFHRCSMRMTAADQAVAQCDGVAVGAGADSEGPAPRATWTFDFQRTGGRWAIRRVTHR